jgi:hypothetical protein
VILDRSSTAGPWLIYMISVVLVLGAGELGRRLGVRDRARDGGAAQGTNGNLESALFTLLALMVGFSFAMAMTRFDARRDVALQEANAIGTAALRSQELTPQPAATSLALLRDYARTRLDIAHNPRSLDRVEAMISDSDELQRQLWRIAMDASAADPRSVGVGLYVQSLNAMIDLQETRLMAGRSHVPDVVFLLLYAIAMVAVGFAGYRIGMTGPRGRVPNAIMGVLIATVIGLIVDIDHPRSGLVTVSQQPMLDLAASLGL